MKRRRGQHGFTVMETLIFLAVSTGLFLATVSVVKAHQDSTAFTFAMHELTSQLRDTINDTGSGFYKFSSDVRCNRHPAGGGPNQDTVRFSGGGPPEAQGERKDCIFVGRILHFSPSNPPAGIPSRQVMRTYSMIGLRLKPDPPFEDEESSSVDDANPTIITNGDAAGSVQETVLPGGMELDWARIGGVGGTDATAFGFVTNFAAYTTTLIDSDARNVRFFTLTNTPPNSYDENGIKNDYINKTNMTEAYIAANSNPVELCFEYRGYFSIVTVGDSSRDLTTDLRINKGTCP